MIINPNTAIEMGWLKFPSWMSEEQKQKSIQPNAIDLTADNLFNMTGVALLSETSKVMRNYSEVDLTTMSSQQVWLLKPQYVYDVMSDFYVEVPEGVAAELVIRSTLNRCGIAINSGIWDSGFKGHIGMAMFNRSDYPFYLAPHTRVCQIKFTQSDSAGVYAGGYNTTEGQRHWSDKEAK